jgi:hypothetical protein
VSFWQKVRPHKRIHRGPIRDKKFRSFVRTFPCCACGYFKSQAAHTGTDGGASQKAADRTCAPLCFKCHRNYHDIGRKAFERRYGISFSVIVSDLNARYERRSQLQQPNSIAEWQRREEERERRIDQNYWDLQQPLPVLERITRKVGDIHVPEWGCRCIQTDVDEWDARGCPEHGNPAAEKEREAAELVGYYQTDFDLASRKPTASADSSTVGSNGADIHETFSFNKKEILL